MPDQNQNYNSSGTRYSNVTRLVLTALLSGIAFTAVIAFLVLCYRSHWKAGALRAFPQEPQPVVQPRYSPGIRAPFQHAVEVQHPDGTLDYVKPMELPLQPLQLEREMATRQ